MNADKWHHIAEPQDRYCPHLGLEDDQKTISSYASALNVCYHCQPKEAPTLSHQQQHCLEQRFVECEIYTGLSGEKMPKDIRHIKSQLPSGLFLRYGLLGLVIVAIVIICILSGFFRMTELSPVESMGIVLTTEPRNGQLIFLPQPTQQSSPFITFSTSTPRATADPPSTINLIPTATRTSIPTVTSNPTLTPTPTCSTPIPLYAMSYLGESYLLSFKLPVDLDPYLVTDPFGYLTLALDLPDFSLTQNDKEIDGYKIFLRDMDTTDLLFIDILTTPGRVIAFEFTAQGTRYCSMPIVIARPDQISASTPTPAP